MKRIFNPTILLLTIFSLLAPVMSATEPILAGQPLSEYKTRRQKLMEQVKDA
jgi:hypothetical protein